MDWTYITHVNDGFVFLGHRVIRKRGPRDTMRSVTTIPKDKFRNFAHKLVKELSSNHSETKIDKVESLNRKLTGWANFYQFTAYNAVITEIKSLMRQWIRRLAEGKAKIWQLFGRSGNDSLSGITLRQLVTSRKAKFRWRNPEINPHIMRDEERNSVTSRYYDVAMAMSHA